MSAERSEREDPRIAQLRSTILQAIDDIAAQEHWDRDRSAVPICVQAAAALWLQTAVRFHFRGRSRSAGAAPWE